MYSRITVLLCVLTGSPTVAVAQSLPEAPAPDLQTVDPRPADDCDGDAGGALIGTAIGLSPALLMPFIGDDDEAGVALGLGLIGGFLGFWIGLAVDSASCTQEGEAEPDGVSTREARRG